MIFGNFIVKIKITTRACKKFILFMFCLIKKRTFIFEIVKW